jgi:hypothetical protein
MSAIQSNTDAILVAIPMVAVMFAVNFRLDEIISRHKKPAEQGHALSDWDRDGHPVCIEPDGKLHRRPAVQARVEKG